MLTDAQTIAFGRAMGIASLSPTQYIDRERLELTDDALRAVFSQQLYARSIQLTLQAPDVAVTTPKGNRIKLFGARFLVFPVMCCMLTARERAPGDASIFAIAPNAEEQNAFFPGFGSLWFDHVIDVLGYLRFYAFGSHFLVMEIQSDVFGQIEQPEIRGRYSHWHRLLLAAFERYVMEVSPGARVSFTTSAYIFSRYKHHVNRNLVDSLYVRLPKNFAYNENISIDLAIEPMSKPRQVGKVQSKLLRSHELVELNSPQSLFDMAVKDRYTRNPDLTEPP